MQQDCQKFKLSLKPGLSDFETHCQALEPTPPTNFQLFIDRHVCFVYVFNIGHLFLIPN